MHPETNSLAPDGSACAGPSHGLLRRRPITALYLTHVGKESNRLEEVQAGLVHDPEEVYTAYSDPAHDPWRTLVVPVLKRMKRALLMEQTGLDRSTITRLRNGPRVPQQKTREMLTRTAGDFARAQLQARGHPWPPDDLQACAAYLGR